MSDGIQWLRSGLLHVGFAAGGLAPVCFAICQTRWSYLVWERLFLFGHCDSVEVMQTQVRSYWVCVRRFLIFLNHGNISRLLDPIISNHEQLISCDTIHMKEKKSNIAIVQAQ
jgi:hypothetical protein